MYGYNLYLHTFIALLRFVDYQMFLNGHITSGYLFLWLTNLLDQFDRAGLFICSYFMEIANPDAGASTLTLINTMETFSSDVSKTTGLLLSERMDFDLLWGYYFEV